MSINYTKEQLYEAYSVEHHAHKQTQAKLNEAYAEIAYLRKINKAREFIIRHFKSDLVTIDRCLYKATTICLQDDMICVMDNEWVYYFGSAKNTTFRRKEYQFYKKFTFSGKKINPSNINGYKNHVKLVNNHYIWV